MRSNIISLSPPSFLQRIQDGLHRHDAPAPAPDPLAGQASWWTSAARSRPAPGERNRPGRRAATLALSSTIAGGAAIRRPELAGRPHGSLRDVRNGIGQDTARFGSFRSLAATHAVANLSTRTPMSQPADIGLVGVRRRRGRSRVREVASAEVAGLCDHRPRPVRRRYVVEVRSRLEQAQAAAARRCLTARRRP